ncbi:MAG: imidazole glycerol phosphate synthase subunit HisH [Pseudomonadota bacterium]
MDRTVSVVDYGIGNLLSVIRAFERIGANVELVSDADSVAAATRLVLPGVGAFGDGMSELRKRGVVDAIQESSLKGTPVLGICLGMQMLLGVSLEFGRFEGLGIIDGVVEPVPREGTHGQRHKIPHIGWNTLKKGHGRSWDDTILAATAEGSAVYFVHSYMAVPTDRTHLLAGCDYNGVEVSAVVSRDNVYGTQFHPEKSGDVGLRILGQFMEIG